MNDLKNTPSYWCCNADFGKHDATCANYKHIPIAVSAGVWQTVSGQKAIVLVQMPNGHWAGYVEACSLATAWCEDGQNTQRMTSYDLTVAEEAL